MKNFIKTLSLLALVILCLSVVGTLMCMASQASTEAVTDTSSETQTQAPSDAQTEEDEKKGIFSNLDPMNMDNITKSLEILVKGMVAIFAVVIIIIIVVKLIQKVIAVLTAPPKDEE